MGYFVYLLFRYVFQIMDPNYYELCVYYIIYSLKYYFVAESQELFTSF